MSSSLSHLIASFCSLTFSWSSRLLFSLSRASTCSKENIELNYISEMYFPTCNRWSNLYCSSSFMGSFLSDPFDFLPPPSREPGPILLLGFHPFSLRTLSISSFISSQVNLTYFSSPLSSVSPLGRKKSPTINFVLKLKFSRLMLVTPRFSRYLMMSGYCLNLLPHGAT